MSGTLLDGLFGESFIERREYFYVTPISRLIYRADAPLEDVFIDNGDPEYGREANTTECGMCRRYGVFGVKAEGNIQNHWSNSPLWRAVAGEMPNLCEECYEKSIPFSVALRDIVELRLYVNKLKKVINERNRTENDRTHANDVGERG